MPWLREHVSEAVRSPPVLLDLWGFADSSRGKRDGGTCVIPVVLPSITDRSLASQRVKGQMSVSKEGERNVSSAAAFGSWLTSRFWSTKTHFSQVNGHLALLFTSVGCCRCIDLNLCKVVVLFIRSGAVFVVFFVFVFFYILTTWSCKYLIKQAVMGLYSDLIGQYNFLLKYKRHSDVLKGFCFIF